MSWDTMKVANRLPLRRDRILSCALCPFGYWLSTLTAWAHCWSDEGIRANWQNRKTLQVLAFSISTSIFAIILLLYDSSWLCQPKVTSVLNPVWFDLVNTFQCFRTIHQQTDAFSRRWRHQCWQDLSASRMDNASWKTFIFHHGSWSLPCWLPRFSLGSFI